MPLIMTLYFHFLIAALFCGQPCFCPPAAELHGFLFSGHKKISALQKKSCTKKQADFFSPVSPVLSCKVRQ
jgi:hypothetical protein